MILLSMGEIRWGMVKANAAYWPKMPYFIDEKTASGVVFPIWKRTVASIWISTIPPTFHASFGSNLNNAFHGK